ncbi:hypothetical protein SAMD00019534_119090 [Acytostelium subglobosum LB1]|uniref:hypothetical protein n=1 Tax=Acytostelium subglobosum LB1 TaxID=1410327 RepID=UPI000644E883|nr:hypothetical protein SAMD00019534_119090 [Acytostelium subglobosum LB1]GAM28733.1 hypothetical protein SAMD00019534_119090 [Acytostelium subglobosum LB1]|eukprot:XP_012748288.1 hypothetical protein SAMD00019534_119090 [Acytostelium subglobosum LB1]
MVITYATAQPSSTNPTRTLSLQYSLNDKSNYQPFNIAFYSYNTCGDFIFDPNEKCHHDEVAGFGHPNLLANSTCGNEVCDESNPNECLADCYYHFGPRACDTPYEVIPGTFVQFTTSDDTLGKLIANQMVWRVPGYNQLQFGMDVTTGIQAPQPIFRFDLCDDGEQKIIQDVYRGTFYQVPKELSVVPLPQCTFSTNSSFHSDAQSLKTSMTLTTSETAQANADFSKGGMPIGISLSASFSNDKSVTKAMKMSSKNTGSLIDTSVTCYSLAFELNLDRQHIPWSSNFLIDISRAIYSKDFSDLVVKYGTHIYLTGRLGGNLKQITQITSSEVKEEDESSYSQQASRTLATAVTSPVFSANANYNSDTNEEVNEQSMKQFVSKTTRTSVITYGGAPGSYGPGDDSTTSTFGVWANTIDQLPIVVDYQIIPIRALLPETWTTIMGESILAKWTQAELEYYVYQINSAQGMESVWMKEQTLHTFTMFNGKFKTSITSVSAITNLTTSYIDLDTASPGKGEHQISTDFPFSLDTLSHRVYINVSQDNTPIPMNTEGIPTKDLNGDTSNFLQYTNLIMVASGTTDKFSVDYRWDLEGSSNSGGYVTNLWKPYQMKDGLLSPIVIRDTSFLLIPPMPIAYTSMAINVNSGGYTKVVYVNLQVQVPPHVSCPVSIPQPFISL